VPPTNIIWTKAMQRLFILLSRALKFNEPVLLVGETGSGKTSVCQVFADAVNRRLHGLSCHQNTETADIIGGLRPLRNRQALTAETIQEAASLLQQLGLIGSDEFKPQVIQQVLDQALKSSDLGPSARPTLEALRTKLVRSQSIFEWRDGPLIEAMRAGEVFLLDEISLAEDSVLERLNSVLEPDRTIVLAERGGAGEESPVIQADEGFRLVATMNPGGDYGKKELSPALRNRFTEIWVPQVDDRRDLQLISDSMWLSKDLHSFTGPMLDFIEWLCARIGDRSILTLRDILVSSSMPRVDLPLTPIFRHGSHSSTVCIALRNAPLVAAKSS
jgi:midasin